MDSVHATALTQIKVTTGMMASNSRHKVFQFSHYLGLSTIALLLSLAGCGGITTKPDDAQADKPSSMAAVERFLAKTDSFEEPQKTERMIGAAEFLLDNNDVDWARSITKKLRTRGKEGGQLIRLLTLKATIAQRDGEPYIAKRFLLHSRSDKALPSTDYELAANFLDMRATLLFNQAEFLNSVDQRLTLHSYIQGDELRMQLNHDLMWEALAEMPTEELFTLSKTEKNEVKQGWLSLAALSKSNGTNFRQQIKDIAGWRDIWPSHPANTLLPADLQLILQLAENQAKNIAIMLPFTGRLSSASAAIKEGILAAFYDDTQENTFAPTLSFHDTKISDINTLFDTAVSNGAELIIGPLSKENVSALAKRNTLNIPVLALNTTNTHNSADTSIDLEAEIEHPELYQFSLAIESESRQVAERAWQDGHRSVLILAPANPWGDRSVNAFKSEWQRLGGRIIDDSRYKDQRSFSPLIEGAVAVNQSKVRHTQLERIFGANLEFEPRRRKDIDFVFLLGYPNQGKQVKPLLAFHYAGDIPIYSTSQIYAGENGAILRDLSGIRFATLPWFFDDSLNERRAVQAYSPNANRYPALYALGVDAYHIYPRLTQLKKISQASFYGSTGKLSVSPHNTIEREQTWAQIKGSNIVELTTVTEDEETTQ